MACNTTSLTGAMDSLTMRCSVVPAQQNAGTLVLDDRNCQDQLAFVCQTDNLVLVKENKTWEEAIHYCRALHLGLTTFKENTTSDILTFHAEDEFADIQVVARQYHVDEVWIGLRWLAGR